MKEKCKKISNIEVVEEIKYLGVIVQAKRNVFEGQKNEIARSRLLYLRRIETGNNTGILEDSRKHKKSKWWETTRKYMNWAQIEEREIKERTAKEIRGKIVKVVEEE